MDNLNAVLDNCAKVSLEVVDKQIELLKEYIYDEQWKNTLMFDISINSELANEIYGFIKIINNKMDFDLFYSLLPKLRVKCNELIHIASKEKCLIFKWYKYRHAYAIYAFAECVIEGSSTTEMLFNNIKDKYGEIYLNVLQEIDKRYPSEKCNRDDENERFDEIDDDLLRIYLLMKRWQDNQHYYHKNILQEFLNARDDFEYAIKNEEYYDKIDGNRLLLICLLNLYPIIPVDLLIRFMKFDICDELSNIIGGKGVGLIKLKALGVNIPTTFFLAVGSVKNKYYESRSYELPDINYVVRSSATLEDGNERSFAGLFKTEFNIKRDNLSKSVDNVKNSGDSQRVKTYQSKFNIKPSHMAVILQEYCLPSFSGVWMGNTLDSGYLEWVEGSGEKLVSGRVKPISEKWDNNTDISKKLCINNIAIGTRCLELQQKIGILSDIEWCIIENEIIYLQYRPLTVKLNCIRQNISCKEVVEKGTYYGFPTSSGSIVGETYYCECINDFKHMPGKSIILVTEFIDPEWVPVLLKCQGIITSEGGFLSHTGILAREFSIPCITGIGEKSLVALQNSKVLFLNGTEGIISVMEWSSNENS
jgi:Phosphoenolpyruvate synthase/pyruvate phosphate dikinase